MNRIKIALCSLALMRSAALCSDYAPSVLQSGGLIVLAEKIKNSSELKIIVAKEISTQALPANHRQEITDLLAQTQLLSERLLTRHRQESEKLIIAQKQLQNLLDTESERISNAQAVLCSLANDEIANLESILDLLAEEIQETQQKKAALERWIKQRS